MTSTSPTGAQPSDNELLQQLEAELLQITNIDRVVRVTLFHIDGETLVVGAKVSLPAELEMRQVSAALTVAERRINRLLPAAKHIFVTPDVYFDDTLTASTSTIVTLSYD